MATALAPIKPRRKDVPKDQVLCDHCTAKCCRYFALPLDTPEDLADFEFFRWFLLHERATIFRESDTWYLLVHTVCRHLQPNNMCGIYETRPQVCRDYSTKDCEYEDDWTYDFYLERPEQVFEYCEATLQDEYDTIRSPKPALLPDLTMNHQRAVGFTPAGHSGDKPRRSLTLTHFLMSSPRIQPRTLKGFRDYLPQKMLPREQIIDTARRVFRSYGFSPIDTPALEYLEILLGKGGAETDKQLYRFQDHGGRDVGLRFDLTVPLARFAAQHIGELGTPFKRYHIASVWRGENTQRGRFREFMQCDFDTIGTKSVATDAEIILVVRQLLTEIGFSKFTVRVNDRSILNGLLQKAGLADSSALVLRALDKLTKIGAEKVSEEMQTVAGATSNQAETILQLAQISGSNNDILEQLEKLGAGNELATAGVARLREVIGLATSVPNQQGVVQIDPSIARGLDYYTGAVLETTLDDCKIGSICSGGRYDNLADLYTNQQLPGIGASLGLDRLLDAMEDLGMLAESSTPAQVFIPYFDAAHLADYLKLAAELRAAGLNVEVYPEPSKLGKQLQYADRKKFRVALIAGEREFAAAECQIKNLSTTESTTVPLNAAAVIAEIRRILAN